MRVVSASASSPSPLANLVKEAVHFSPGQLVADVVLADLRVGAVRRGKAAVGLVVGALVKLAVGLERRFKLGRRG